MSSRPAVRKWHLNQALASFAALNGVLADLTADEVFAALELEAASARRKSILDRLISRAVRLNELDYKRQLKERFPWHANNPK